MFHYIRRKGLTGLVYLCRGCAKVFQLDDFISHTDPVRETSLVSQALSFLPHHSLGRLDFTHSMKPGDLSLCYESIRICLKADNKP